MHKLLVVGVGFGVAIAIAVATALAATPVTVSPATGTAKTAFTVTFLADRKLSPYHFVEIGITSRIARSSCEHTETADVTYAKKGQRISVALHPVDKSRWCPGTYRGVLTRWERVPCGDHVDTSECTSPVETRPGGSIFGRFTFRVSG